MGRTRRWEWGRCLVEVMLCLSALSGSAYQQPSDLSAGADSSPEKTGGQLQQLLPPQDHATYLRIRVELARGFAARPACESDTPTGHAAEIQRALKTFPEIRNDTDYFRAALQQLGLKEVENFPDDEKLLIYRQYEGLTSIHLEPLTRNDEQDTYALTFVPNHQPRCDVEAGGTIKSRWVNVDRQGRVSGGAFSTPVNSSTTTAPLRELAERTSVAPESRPSILVQKITAPELRYRLLEEFGRRRLCECAPLCRGDEIGREIEAFNQVQKDASTFRVIVGHLGLAGKNNFTDAEKRAVYREYEYLRRVDLEPLAVKFKFSIVDNRFTTQGLIDSDGQITILVRKPEPLSGCPICLAGGTLIDTPNGAVPVKELKVGTLVWTLDSKGGRIAAPITETSSVPVPAGHRMVHVLMKDGRELFASPGHPTVDGRTVRDLMQVDIYDGGTILFTETVPYTEASTHDLLPEGDTGFYWANGILLASTLR